MMTALAKRFLEMDKAEATLRLSILKSPDYFANDLKPLIRLQSELSNELLAICLKEGWPSVNIYGWEAANSASRLARHCFSQPQFLRTTLPIIEQSARFGEIGGHWFTQHVDTIMFYENKPQVFGNILTWNQNLEVGPWTIVQPQGVNARREAFGLEPLEEKLAARVQSFENRYKKPSSYETFRSDLIAWARTCGWFISEKLTEIVETN